MPGSRPAVTAQPIILSVPHSQPAVTTQPIILSVPDTAFSHNTAYNTFCAAQPACSHNTAYISGGSNKKRRQSSLPRHNFTYDRALCFPCLRPLPGWDCGFESRRLQGCLSLVCVAHFTGRGLCATGWIPRPEEFYRLWSYATRTISLKISRRKDQNTKFWNIFTALLGHFAPICKSTQFCPYSNSQLFAPISMFSTFCFYH